MSYNVSLSVQGSVSNIANEMLKHIVPEIEKYFSRAFDTLKEDLSSLVVDAIRMSDEYNSLLGGQLKAEFGLPDSAARVENIIKYLENTNFQYSSILVSNGKLKGKFSLNLIQSDFSDILSLPDAVFTTEKGSQLEWLRWLLLEGDTTIIKEYEVVLGPAPNSRTGMAIMRGTTKGKWSVPPQFSGTINNNWLTRVIDSVNNDIENLINLSLKR